MSSINDLLNEIKQQPNGHRLPTFINVEGIIQSQLIIDGVAQNRPCAWGIVEQDGKWIFFFTDDERGYIFGSKECDTEEQACDEARKWLYIQLGAFNSGLKRCRKRLNTLNELYEKIERLKEKEVIVNTYGGCEGDFDNPDGDVLNEFMEHMESYYLNERTDWMEAFYQILCWQFQSCHEGVKTYYENFYGCSEYLDIVETADYLQQNGYTEIYEQYKRGIVECERYEYPCEMLEVAKEIDKWINWHTKEVWDFCLDILTKHRKEWQKIAVPFEYR